MALNVILSGGLLRNGELPHWVQARVKYCIENLRNDDIIVATSCFTLNVPPKLNANGFIISEATAIRNKLKYYGVKNSIYCEQLSHDTVGSIYFTLKYYVGHLSIKETKWITSDFQLAKVKYLVERFSKIMNLTHISMSYVGLETSRSEPREIKEKKDLKYLIDKYSRIDDERGLINKILYEHDNYNHKFGSKRLLNSEQLRY